MLSTLVILTICAGVSAATAPSGVCTCADVLAYINDGTGTNLCSTARADCTNSFTQWSCSMSSVNGVTSYQASCECTGSCKDAPSSTGAGTASASSSSPTPTTASASPSSPTTTKETTAPTTSSALTDQGICERLASVPEFKDGTCSCKATNGGTGIDAECTYQLALVNSKLGLHFDFEPCESPPYAQLSYSLDGKETVLGRFEAGKEYKLEVPGLAYAGAGVYINFEIKGDATDFTVHTSLSLCYGEDCDGNIPFVGSVVKQAGFPLKLATFDDLSFVDSCPANSSMMVAIGGAVAATALLAVVVFCVMHNQRKKADSSTSKNDIEINRVDEPAATTAQVVGITPAPAAPAVDSGESKL